MSFSPVAWIKHWMQRRWQKKPYDELPLPLKTTKKYIFFPWQGMFLWIILTVLVVFCINYNNNLGIMAACFLFVLFMTSLFRNYFVLNKIIITHLTYDHTDASEPVIVRAHVTTTASRTNDLPQLWLDTPSGVVPVVFDAKGQGVAQWSSRLPPGVFHLPRLTIMTWWPHAITRTWVELKIDSVVAVAPSSQQASLSIDNDRHLREQTQVSAISKQGDVDGIREVLPNERPSKIAWRHTAKHQKPMTYVWQSSQDHTVLIQWPDDEQQSPLDKACWMRAQIDTAVLNKRRFQLVHPEFASRPGTQTSFGVSALCSIMERACPAQAWGET